MKFMLTFSWKPNAKALAFQTVRWASPGGRDAFGALDARRFQRRIRPAGSDDPLALAQFALMWTDLMELTIVPVLDDEGLSELLQRSGK